MRHRPHLPCVPSTSWKYRRSPVNTCSKNDMGTLSTPLFIVLPLNYQLPNLHLQPIPSGHLLPCSQLLKYLRSKIEFLVFHQPKPLLLLVASAPIHPGQGWIHTECPSLTPTPSSPASGLHLAWVVLFSLLLNTHCPILSLERPFPNTANQDQLFTPPSQCSLVAVDMGLKLDYPGQIAPCQFFSA